MVGLIIFIILAIAFLAWAWVRGISHMDENHPDYKGDDLFGPFDEDDKDHIL